MREREREREEEGRDGRKERQREDRGKEGEKMSNGERDEKQIRLTGELRRREGEKEREKKTE